MEDWIAELKPGQRVLDLGSGPGSVPGLEVRSTVIALDEDVDAFVHAAPPAPGHCRVFAQGHRMPFAAGSIDLVVCHHAMEHITRLEETLAEVARVLQPDGRVFVSVPDGYGLCDSVYRYVFEGGGHVNRFRRQELVSLVERTVGVHLVRWKRLYSSFVYLWRLAEMLKAPPPGLPKRLLAVGLLPRKAVTTAQHLLYSGTRIADRTFHTGMALYGWAFWFDRRGGEAVEEPSYLNVCRFCGMGHPAGAVERVGRGKFRCSSCSGLNPYFKPFGNTI
jgi:SAM-dependent methyltransferase